MFPAKLCVLMQMLRIFHGTKKDSVYWAILIVIWSNLIFYVTITFGLIVACVPRAKLTNPELSGRCINNYASISATSAINVGSDFSILLLPAFAVWKLKIALKRKMIISAVFGMGLLWVDPIHSAKASVDEACSACISSIIRLVYSVHLTQVIDKSWASEAVCMWAFAEFTTVILAGAFPTIPRLIQWLCERGGSPSCVQPCQKSSKPTYITFSNDLADLEDGHPGTGMQLAMSTPKSYIPFEEDLGRVCKPEIQ